MLQAEVDIADHLVSVWVDLLEDISQQLNQLTVLCANLLELELLKQVWWSWAFS